MATLPAPRAIVNVEPPLSWSGPRLICAPVTVVAPVNEPAEIKLFTDVVGVLPTKSFPLRLFAMMVLERTLIVALLKMPPPLLVPAELPEIVVLMTLKVD